MKKNLLSISIAVALLSACGGSSGGGSGNPEQGNVNDIVNDSTSKTITVIDGYLENAEVYVDRNSNGLADTSEKLTQKTDAEGKVTISLADTQFDLIAQINGDTTKDSDATGTTGRSYQMIAKAGSDFITPFTTIAKIQNKSLAEVATDLNIDESVVSGDYVALKVDTDKGEDAKKAHAYARNLTPSLAETVISNEDSAFTRFLEKIETDIEQAINNDVDLDALVSDVVELEDILVGGSTFYSVVVNAGLSAREDISTFQYNQDGTFDFKNNKSEHSGPFSVTGNQTIYDGESFDDSLLYVSQENYIQVSSEGYLDIYSKTKDQLSISSAMFEGTDWYQIFDDGVYSTTPCFVKVNFTSSTEMKYTESGNCEVADLAHTEGTEYPYHWSVEDNTLSIYDDEAGSEGGEAEFVVISKSERLLVVENTTTNDFSVFIKDQALATKVFSAWALELAY